MVFAKNKCHLNNYSQQNALRFEMKAADNVIVTYEHKDHPANYFAPAIKNRFQLAAILQGKLKSNT